MKAQHSIRSALAGALGIAAVVVVVASGATAGAASTASVATANITIRTGTPYIGTFAPLYLALKAGYFKAQHLNVTLQSGTGTDPVVETIGKGTTQVGFVDTAATAELVSQGTAVKTIMLPQTYSDMGVVSFTSAGITKPTSLYGKHIAATAGDAIDQLWPSFVSATHLDTSRITIDDVAVAIKAVEVLQGADQALMGYEDAQGAQLAAQANKPTRTMLFSSYGIKITGYGIVANSAWLTKNPGVARRLLIALTKAFTVALKNPQKAVAAGEAYNPTFPSNEALAMLKAQNKEVEAARIAGKPIGWMPASAWTTSLKSLAKYGKLTNTQPSKYYTNQYLPSS